MSLSKYREIAIKYHVEDVAGALLPGTPLSNVLKILELNKKSISNIAQNFLRRKRLFGLLHFAQKKITFNEFLTTAKKEKSERHLESKRLLAKAETKALKVQAEQKLKNDAIQTRLRQRSRTKAKQSRLKQKYDLDYFIEKNDYSKLMNILRRVNDGARLSENDIVWLTTDGEKYFTQELREGFHKNEAEFYANKFRKNKNPWSAVNASSHYRKCKESKIADSLLCTINVLKLKNIKLKSAICTTHGGVNRDLQKLDEALSLGERAHKLSPRNFQPCTLLGAVHMEIGNHTTGQSWYEKAIERGYSEKSMDDELKAIFMRAEKSKQKALRIYLLKIDSFRYSWVNKGYNKSKIRS